MKTTVFSLLLILFCTMTCSASPARAADGVPVDERHFPDPIFRQWLLDGTNLNGAGEDGLLTAEELAQITEIRVPGLGIASLEGIEFFPALTTLVCRSNRLTELDMSGNPQLTTLLCDLNQLTRLELSQNSKLVNLNCESNRLVRLDLTGCPSLEWLYCRHNLLEQLDFPTDSNLLFIETFDNRLTNIDLTGLTSLQFLHIDHNKLTHLDLSGNTALVNAGSGFVARNNYLKTIVLPNHENLTVEMDVYAEQDPMEGYARTEWYLDPDFTQPISGDLKAAGQTLYAKWIPNPYTIFFDLNGGTGSAPPISTAYNAPAVLPAGEVWRAGYTLRGWLGYVDGRQRLFAPGETVYSLSGKWDYQTKITLQAQWEPCLLRLEDGVVTGSVPVELPSGPGTCQVIAALYDDETGQMLDSAVTVFPQTAEFVVWDQLRLNAGEKKALTVKVFILGAGLESLAPLPGVYQVASFS